MRGNAIVLINVVFSLFIVYLFKIYMSLASWWISLSRNTGMSSVKAGFFAKADQLHILAILMAGLNLIGAFLLLQQRIGDRRLSIASIVIASATLLLCLIISV